MEITNEFKRMARTAFFDAKKAYEYVLSEDDTLRYRSAPLYLNKAVSQMCAVEALYFAQFNILANSAVEDVIHQFSAFADELLKNYATDHSHQWTLIEFDRYKEALDASPFALET